jgi:peptidase E
MDGDNPLLDNFVLSLARRKKLPRVCFLATASGDSDSYIALFHRMFPPSRAQTTHLRFFERTVVGLRRFVLEQDVIYVGGGSTANLLAIWWLHGLDRVLRAAWHRGIVLAGLSAGAICWFEHGITDSFGRGLQRLDGGLGFLRGGFCPHYDGQAERRPTLHRLIRSGFVPTYALDDGAGAHFAGTRFKEVVSSRPAARAFLVSLKGRSVVETPLPVRYLGV